MVSHMTHCSASPFLNGLATRQLMPERGTWRILWCMQHHLSRQQLTWQSFICTCTCTCTCACMLMHARPGLACAGMVASCRIYRPEKPEGERFKVTNAKTRLARMYHATSILTAKGDIIIVSPSQHVLRLVHQFVCSTAADTCHMPCLG